MRDLIRIDSITKQDIESKATKIIEDVEEGNIEALPVLLQCRAYDRFIKSVLKGITDQATREASDYTVKEYEGVTFQVTTGSRLLDYDQDMEYQLLKSKLDARKEKLKDAQKAHDKGNVMIDSETGEKIEVVGYKSESNPTVKVLFK